MHEEHLICPPLNCLDSHKHPSLVKWTCTSNGAAPLMYAVGTRDIDQVPGWGRLVIRKAPILWWRRPVHSPSRIICNPQANMQADIAPSRSLKSDSQRLFDDLEPFEHVDIATLRRLIDTHLE